ncbi:MAG: protein kinase [Anaeromyxobacter sp.]
MTRKFIDVLWREVRQFPAEARRAELEQRTQDPEEIAQVLALLASEEEEAAAPQHQLGPFLLINKLGEGRHGVVYQAVRAGEPGEVAVKVLRSRSPSALDAVLREAGRAKQIRSDAVVTVYGAGRMPDGTTFIEMGLCSEPDPDRPGAHRIGTTLLAARERITPERAVELVEKLALGVHEAHHFDIVHGDIKPANVLVTPSLGRVMLADFGVASSLAGATVARDLTGRPPRLGTLAYMAPEQFVGREPPTKASDVHCLGATLFELLAGAPPYAGRRLDQEGDVPRAALPRTIDRRLREIVARALDLDPARRPPSALALAEELRAYRTLRPTAAEQRMPLRRLVLGYRRNRVTVNLLLGAAVAALLVGSGPWLALVAEREALRVEIRAEQNQLEKLQLSNAGLEASKSVLEEQVRAQQAVATQRDGLKGQLEAVERRRTELQGQLKQRENELEAAKQAAARAEGALTEARAVHESDRVRLRAAAVDERARTEEAVGKLRSAEALLKQERESGDAREREERRRADDALGRQRIAEAQLADRERRVKELEALLAELKDRPAKGVGRAVPEPARPPPEPAGAGGGAAR